MKKSLSLFLFILTVTVSSYANPIDSLANYEPNSSLGTITFSWIGSDIDVVDNPVSDAVNSSSGVLEFTRSSQYSSALGLNNFGNNNSPKSLFQYPIVKLKAMSETTTSTTISVSASDINGYSVSIDKTMPANANEWADFEFDFTSYLLSTPISFIESITILVNYGNASTGDKYYIDDVVFSGPEVTSIDESTVLTIFQEQYSGNAWWMAENNNPRDTAQTISFFRTAQWGNSALTGSADHYIATDSMMQVMVESGSGSEKLFPATERAGLSYIEFVDFSITGLDNLSISYDLQWVTAPSAYTNAITVEYQLDGGAWTELTTSSTLPSGTGSWTKDISYILPALNGEVLNFRLTNNEAVSLYVDNITLSGTNVFASDIEISAPDTVVLSGGSLQLSNVVSPANANQEAYWYISAGDSAASIDATTGLLTTTTKQHGVATVTAIAKDKTGKAVDSKVIYVYYPADSIAVKGEGGADSIKVLHGPLQMVAEVYPDTADVKTVEWSTEAITGNAQISESGLLTAQKNGKVKVIARAVDGSGVYGVDTVTIVNQVDSIHVISEGNVDSIKSISGTLQMDINVFPATDTIIEVTWSLVSDAGIIATITDAGILQAQANGVVYVKAVTEDGSEVVDSMKITIINQVAVESIEITSKAGFTLDKDDQIDTLTANILPTNAGIKMVEWFSSDTGISDTLVLSVIDDTTVAIRAVRNGSVTIIGKSVSNDVADTVEISIINQVVNVDSIVINGAGVITELEEEETLSISVDVYPEDAADKTVNWNSGNEAVATVNSSGKITAIAEGTAWIKATSVDGSKTDSLEITVIPMRTWSKLTVENIVVGSVDSPIDFSGNVEMSWDTDSVYMVFVVADDVITVPFQGKWGPNNYACDNIEIYFDMDNSKNIHWPRNGGWVSDDPTFDDNDYQLRLNPNSTPAFSGADIPISLDTEITGTGYTFSISIPWDSLMNDFNAVAGTQIGFDLMISDNDVAESEDSRNQIAYNSISDKAFNDPSLWTTFELAADGSFIKITDTEAPSAPSALAGTDSIVTWEPATDNVAVYQYILYNGSTEVDTIYAKESGNTYTFVGLEEGSYSLGVVALDNYNNASQKVTVDVTISSGKSDVNVTEMTTFNVYPNPSNGIFNIYSEEVNDVSITVYGIAGQQIFTDIFNRSYTLDLTDVRPGMYIVHLNNGAKVEVVNLIVR